MGQDDMYKQSQSIGTDSYRVDIEKFHNIKYSEGDHVAIIPGERLGGNIEYVLYAALLNHWQAPYEKEKLTHEESKRIIANVVDALRSWGVTFEVQ